MNDFSDFDLSGIAQGIRNKDFTSKEVTEWSIKKLKSRGTELNAVSFIDEESAIKRSEELDGLLGKGYVMGDLHGVPLAHKDLFNIRAWGFQAGSALLKGIISSETAPTIELMNRAGQVNVGTLQMSEFALSPTGYNAHYGSGANPWNQKYISGGSSSGSGIAVADRMVFGSIGGDTGGSIRIPAAMCGLTGLKTTFGLYDSEGVFPLSESLDSFGPICQTASDCRLLLESSISKKSISYKKINKNKVIKIGKRISNIKICVLSGFIEEESNREIKNSINNLVFPLRN